MIRTNCLPVFILFLLTIFASQAQDEELISLYKGSELKYDDNIGFETFYYLSGANSHKTVDGKIIRKFCAAPENVSPYEIIKNYEKAITAKGGEVIYLTRDGYRYKNTETDEWVWFMRDLFTNGRQGGMDRGWAYAELPRNAQDYVVGKIATPEYDIFISIAAVVIDEATYYSIITAKTEPMDMNNVTVNVLNDGIVKNGRVAIYDVYFDTGKSEVKTESSAALKIISDYLKKNSDQKFLIVGHTDNTGDFDVNIKLSMERAKAVFDKLTSEYGVNSDQLKPYGVGSTVPQMSNAEEAGRARNRRVELVQL